MRGVIAIILGLALILWPELLPKIIVQIIAAFSFAAGLVMLVITLKNMQSKDHESGITVLNSINICIYLILGILIFLYPGFFISILTFFFGAILIIFGIGQLMNLIFSNKHASVPAGLYVIAIIITLCGIALFFNPFQSLKILMIFFGSILLLYGLVEFVTAWRLKSIKFSKEGDYIPYEEVKEEQEVNETSQPKPEQ
jgi:Uncharacterized conserved protein